MGKRALVLAGGGSRGAYQIGVWKALRQLGIDFQLVTGSSVGALNGALMVQGSFEEALALWENISSSDVMSDVLTEPLPNNSPATVWGTFIRDVLEQGGCDIAPLEALMRRSLDEERFRASPIDFGLVTVEYPLMKPLELRKSQIPPGQVCDYLLASSACFPAFKMKEIDGVKYVDGGYHDNMPMNLALSMGATELIAVDLQSVGLIRRPKTASKENLLVIHSHWNLGPFIYFDKSYSRRNIALGYLDGLKAFGRCYGWKYAFDPQDCQEQLRPLLRSLYGLLAQARSQQLGLVNSLESSLGRSLVRDLGDLGLSAEELSPGRLLLRMAEYGGEIFGLDPCVLQPLETFHRQLLEGLQQVLREADLSLGGPGSLTKVVEELKTHDRKYICAFLYKQLSLFLEKGPAPKNLLLFAPVFPEELLAALYLLLLQNRDLERWEPALF